MKLRSESLQEQVKQVRVELRLRDENQGKMLQLLATDMKGVSQTLDFNFELRERVAALEARMPKQ